MLKYALPALTPLILRFAPAHIARPLLNDLGRRLYEKRGCRVSDLVQPNLPAAIQVQTFAPLPESNSELSANGTLVFLPGFASLPNLRDPGVLLETARDYNLSFARFYHPHMITPSQLTYQTMIAEATAVVENAQGPVVLAASSFGAGMAHLVAHNVNQRAQQAGAPDKVVGLYAWSAVTPDTLTDLIEAHVAFNTLAHHQDGALRLKAPTQSRPIPLSWAQIAGIKAHNAAEKPILPFNHPALYQTGAQDPLSHERYIRRVAAQLGPHTQFELLAQTGHNLTGTQQRTGLSHMLEAAGFAKKKQSAPAAA